MYPTAALTLFLANATIPTGWIDCARTSMAADCERLIDRALRDTPRPIGDRPRVLIKLPESGDLSDLEKFLEQNRRAE